MGCVNPAPPHLYKQDTEIAKNPQKKEETTP